ncbi:MAG TPA: isoprenylcysteine carboxylmethyltransferase family protein [Candidatus Eisenbacteria bacterium]|nr:isoprenylcysteine carboxylmethyltransferase family protein [Candidatus Eisenbacteria bacterium]
MRATDFEFRHRFWIIFALFWAGFGAYAIQHANLAVGLLRVASGGAEPSAPAVHAIFAFAALFGVAAGALRSWASAYLRSGIVHDTALHAEGLVADGPFRFVRNPLYLGNILLALGMALLMSPLGALVVVVGQTIFLLRLIRREEWELAQAEGDRFAAYKAAVPMLIPSLTPRVPSGRTEPHIVEGIVGESFTWILVLAMAVFAFTLNSRLIPYFVGVGFLVYWLLFVVWKKRGRAGSGAAKAAG